MYGILLILVGAVNIYYATKFLTDPSFASNYVKKSPKAYIWRKMFGEEKSIKIIRRLFAPLGIILGTGFILFGGYLAYITFV